MTLASGWGLWRLRTMQKILLAAAVLVLAAPAFANEGAGEGASAYKIETTSALKLKKGEKGDAHVTIVPRSDAHVSPDAPLSMSLSSGPAIKLAKTKLGRGDGTATPQQGMDFKIPVTAAASGKDEVKGQLSFFICTEKLCEKQKKEVSLAVLVE